MMPQSAFTICSIVDAAHLEKLRAILAGMTTVPGMADPDNALVPFGQFHTLHFARFIIVEAQTNEDARIHGEEPRPWRPMLVFMGDCDGSRDDVLADLVTRARHGLETIFSCCERFKAGSTDLLQWMQARNVVPAASYVNWVGRTVVQAQQELALHRMLREQLVQIQQSSVSNDPTVIHRELQTRVNKAIADGELILSSPPKTPLGWRIRNLLDLVLVLLILILLTPLMLILAPFYLFILRRKEKTDPEILFRPDPKLVERLTSLEDHLVTNQFSAFGDVKPG